MIKNYAVMPSTVIADMNYIPENKILRIRFISGLVYEYIDVPGKVYAAMKNAVSKGTYLNRYIKGHYSYRKVSWQTQDFFLATIG